MPDPLLDILGEPENKVSATSPKEVSLDDIFGEPELKKKEPSEVGSEVGGLSTTQVQDSSLDGGEGGLFDKLAAAIDERPVSSGYERILKSGKIPENPFEKAALGQLPIDKEIEVTPDGKPKEETAAPQTESLYDLALTDTEKWYGAAPSPRKKIASFNEEAKAIQSKYQSQIDNGLDVDENAYNTELSELANRLGLTWENGDVKVSQGEIDKYQEVYSRKLNERLSRLSEAKKNPYIKDVINKLGAGSAGVLNTPYNAMALSEKAGNALLGLVGVEPSTYWQDFATYLNSNKNELSANSQRYEEDIVSLVQNGDMGAAIGKAGLDFAETLPMLITLIMGNAAGATKATLGFMGGSKSAEEYMSLNNRDDIGEFSKIIDALGVGVSEILFEKTGTVKILNGIKKGIQEKGQNIVRDELVKMLQTNMQRNISLLMQGNSDMVREGVSEAMTQLADNLIKKATVDPNIDIWEGVTDSAIVGGLIGKGINLSLNAANHIQTKGTRKAVTEAIKQVPQNYSLEAKEKIATLTLEKQAIQDKTKDAAKPIQEIVSPQIKAIDEEIKKIAAKEEGIELPVEEKPKESEKKKPEVKIPESEVKISPEGITSLKEEKTTERPKEEKPVEKEAAPHEKAYEESIAKKSEEDLAKMPTYSGKKFSLATILPNGDISNVYVRSEGQSHKTYMSPEDATAYEEGRMTLGYWSPAEQKFMEAPQKGKEFGQKVMDIAASKVKIPEVETKITDINKLGREIALDKPNRKDYEEGKTGDEKYVSENIKYNERIDNIINNINQEGTLIDNQGNEYQVEINTKGLIVRDETGSKLYYGGKRISKFAPFVNGFKFKPKLTEEPTDAEGIRENAGQVQEGGNVRQEGQGEGGQNLEQQEPEQPGDEKESIDTKIKVGENTIDVGQFIEDNAVPNLDLDKKEIAKEKIASGIRDLLASGGLIQMAEGQKRIDPLTAMKQIAEGFMELGIENITDLTNKIKTYLKKTVGLDSKVVDDLIYKVDLSKVHREWKKKPPSTKKIINEAAGVKKQREKVVTNDYELLKEKFNNISRGSKEGFKAAVELKNKAIDYLKEKIKKEKPQGFYQREINSALSALEKANTESKLEDAINKIDEAFEKINRKDEITDANKRRKQIKKDVKRGKFSSQSSSVKDFIKIIPSIVSTEKWNQYKDFINQLSGKGEKIFNVSEFNKFVKDLKKEYELEIEKRSIRNEKRKEIYDRINELSNIEDAEIINTITDEFDVSESYAKGLLKSYRNKELIQEITEEQIAEERTGLINDIKQKRKDLKNSEEFNELSKEEKEIIEALNSIKDEELDLFDNTQLETMITILEKAEQGWVSGQAWKNFVRPVMEKRIENKIKPAIEKAAQERSPIIRRIRNLFRGRLFDKKDVIDTLTDNELYKIDEFIGQQNDKPIYKYTLAELVNAAVKSLESKEIIKKANDILKKVKRSAFDSTVLMEMYLRQREHESNGKEGNIVKEYVEKTIGEKIVTDSEQGNISVDAKVYDKDSKQRIKELYNSLQLKEDGNIDMDKLWNMLEKGEQEFIRFRDEVDNNDLFPKIKTTEELYRGNYFEAVNDHSRIVTDIGNKTFSDNPTNDLIGNNMANNPLSARAGTSHSRVPGVRPIRFDAVGNFYRNVRETYFDYYMTPAIKTVFGALNNLSKEYSGNAREFVNGIIETYKQALNTEYKSRNIEYDEWGKFVNQMLRNTYQSILASFRRIPAESFSNLLGAVIIHPEYLAAGVKSSDSFKELMDFTGSVHKERLGRDTFDLIESEIRDNSANRLNSTHSVGQDVNNFLRENVIRKFKDKTSKFIVTSSDNLIGKPYWRGAFINEFKKLTKEDYNNSEFVSNSEYRKQYKEQIIQAAREADYQTSLIINTASPLESMQALRGHDQRLVQKTINNFVRSFSANETTTAWMALKSLAGKGTLDKFTAARVLTGVVARQYVYNAIMMASYMSLSALFMPQDEREKRLREVTKMFQGENLMRDILAANLSLMFGKFGNLVKIPLALGMEHLNKKFTENKLGRKYDRFKDNIMFLPFQDISKTKDLAKATGPYGQIAKFGFDLGEAIAKGGQESEWTDIIDITLTGLDLTVGVPFYRDITQSLRAVDYANSKYIRLNEAINQAIIKNDFSIIKKESLKIKDYDFNIPNNRAYLSKRFYYGRIREEKLHGLNIGFMLSNAKNDDKVEHLLRLKEKIGENKFKELRLFLNEEIYIDGHTYSGIITNDIAKKLIEQGVGEESEQLEIPM